MYKKSWLIPIVVLFFCGITMVSYQKNTQSVVYAQPREVPPSSYVPPTPTDIVKVDLSWPNLHFIFERIESTWNITSPSYTSADSSAIYDMITALLTPGNLNFIAYAPEDLEAYGIYDYSPELTFYDITDVRYNLIQGAQLPDGSSYTYNPLNNCIYTIPKKITTLISRDLTHWFDKNYTLFNPSNTKKITLSSNSFTHEILASRIHDTVRFASSTLSDALVSDIINFLSTTRATSFIDSNISDLVATNYGFDETALHITIEAHTGNDAQFAISKLSTTSSELYVLASPHKTLLTIPNIHIKK